MAIFGEAGPDPEGGRGSAPGFRRKARWHSLKATRLSLLHNYRGSGGRGQPPASAGAPEPVPAGFGGVPARRSVAECRIPSPVGRRSRTPGRAVPFRGRRRGVRRCRWRGVQTMSRISCWTVRASIPKNGWQATLRFPRTRTCRPPYESFRAELTLSTPGTAGGARGRGGRGPPCAGPAPRWRGGPPSPRPGGRGRRSPASHRPRP